MEEMKMKKLMMSSVLVLFVLSGLTFGMGHAGHDHAFAHYVKAQEALAADNFADAKKALTDLSAAVKGDFKALVDKAANAADIAAMRKAFKPLSAMVAKKGAPEGYGVAYCPMADNNTGGYWVQKKGDIANPYFGSSMLRCGSFKEYKEMKKE
jgi:hypothetical protein